MGRHPETHTRGAAAAAACVSRCAPTRRIRCGMTLIELLVVIVILTTLVAAAIPIMSPSTFDRRIREASRGVNSFISAAQARAVALRRPVGVALKVLSQDTGLTDPLSLQNDNDVCLELYYVEQPPAFTGFSDSSRVMVSRITPNRVMLRFVYAVSPDPLPGDGLPAGHNDEPLPPNLVKPGDAIRIGGSEYWINGQYGASSRWDASPVNKTGQLLATEFTATGTRIREARSLGEDVVGQTWTAPAQYTILRQPTPTSAEPYQLPEGVAIDLRGSGTDSFFFRNRDVHPASGQFASNSAPIYIMFSPDGSIERVQLTGTSPTGGPKAISEPIVSSVYLLIGRRENIPVPQLLTNQEADPTVVTGMIASQQEDELAEQTAKVNWLNLESRWVALGGQSGRVVSQENAFVNLREWATAGSADISSMSAVQRRHLQISESRGFARGMTRGEGR